MYKNMKKLVVSTMFSVAIASLFTTQIKAYDETHEVENVNGVYYNEIADSLNEYTVYLEEEIIEEEVGLFAEDADDAEGASDSEETSDTEEVDAQQDSESVHVDSETADVFDSDIRNTTTDEIEIIEESHVDEEEELSDETGDELIEEVDEGTFWTLEELLHEIAQLEQIQVQPQDDESSDTMAEEVPLTDEEIQAILDGTPTTLEELELYFYTKLGNDPFLMEYFYKNLETDKLLSTYFKGVEAFDLPEGYFTRTDDENRKLRAYFYQVLQLDPYFREYFYRSEETTEALEDKEMEEGTAFFKRGGRRTTY